MLEKNNTRKNCIIYKTWRGTKEPAITSNTITTTIKERERDRDIGL